MADKTQELKDFFADQEAQKIMGIATDRVLDIVKRAAARYMDEECTNGDDRLRFAARLNDYADAMEAVDQKAVENGEDINIEAEKQALKAEKEIKASERKVEDLIRGLLSGGLPRPVSVSVNHRRISKDDLPADFISGGGRVIGVEMSKGMNIGDILPIIMGLTESGMLDKIMNLEPNEADKSAENGEGVPINPIFDTSGSMAGCVRNIYPKNNNDSATPEHKYDADEKALFVGKDPEEPDDREFEDDDDGEVQDTAGDENVEDEGSIGDGVIDEDEAIAEQNEPEQVAESEAPAAEPSGEYTANSSGCGE